MMAVAWLPLAWLAVLHIGESQRPAPAMDRHPRRRPSGCRSSAASRSRLSPFSVSSCVLAVLLVLCVLAPFRSLFYTAAACLLGILLASVQFIPTAQLTNHSVAQYRADWLGTGGGLFPQSLVSLVLPNHYGIFDTSQFHGPGDITFLYHVLQPRWDLALALYAVATQSQTGTVVALRDHGGLRHLLDARRQDRRLALVLSAAAGEDPHRHPSRVHVLHPDDRHRRPRRARPRRRFATRDAHPVGRRRVIIALDLFLVGSGRP